MQFACAAIGGGLIGVAAVLLMSLSGRIAGISGIIGGLLPPKPEHNWRLRLSFIAGLLLAPMVLNVLAVPNGIGDPILSHAAMIPAGLLIGIGSALGNGCTSGHGICGLARLSPRSLLATATFMLTAMATVLITRHLS